MQAEASLSLTVAIILAVRHRALRSNSLVRLLPAPALLVPLISMHREGQILLSTFARMGPGLESDAAEFLRFGVFFLTVEGLVPQSFVRSPLRKSIGKTGTANLSIGGGRKGFGTGSALVAFLAQSRPAICLNNPVTAHRNPEAAQLCLRTCASSLTAWLASGKNRETWEGDEVLAARDRWTFLTRHRPSAGRG